MNRAARHVGAWMALTAFVAGCASTSKPAPPVTLHEHRPTAVALQRNGQHILVRATVNGRDAGALLVDTGSNVTALERGAANRLQLPVTGEGRAHGIAGVETMRLHKFDSLAVGGFRLRPRALASLNFPGSPWAGILGYDALAEETFTLDQRAGSLILGDTFDDTLHVERILDYAGLPVVEATLAGRTVRLLLDTGADNELSLHEDVVRRYPEMLSVPHTGPGRSRGVGGSVAGSLAWVRQMSLLGVTLRDVPVSIDPRPAGLSDPRIAGRVGNALLSQYRLTFDPPRRRLAAAWMPR